MKVFADQTFLTVLSAVLLDFVAGEPPCFHPLVGFGNIAGLVDGLLFQSTFRKAHLDPDKSAIRQRAIGVLALAICVLPFVSLSCFFSEHASFLTGLFILYLSIGAHSLFQHSSAVARALKTNDLKSARQLVGKIVSRNTESMSEQDIARAAIESVLENGCDAIFGSLFWFVILGPAGAVLFRLVNTLDAMWGYKTEKFLHFGWAAARSDDVLCFIPARLTAASYAIAGNTASAIKCWADQAPKWYSPNAGPVMAAGAGALQVSLGGRAVYHGQPKDRPALGEGRPPGKEDIERANRLVLKALLIWLLVLLIKSIFL